MPKPYPAEFRRKVLDLLAAGRSVASLATDLGVSAQTIYNWRKQDAIDRGLAPGLSSTELVELKAARRRIAELEAELAVISSSHRRLVSLSVPRTSCGGCGSPQWPTSALAIWCHTARGTRPPVWRFQPEQV